jgi:uncharacterized protein (TIGR04255 family)
MRPSGVVRRVLRYLNRVDIPATVMPSEVLKVFPRLPDETTRRAPFQLIVDEGSEKGGPAVVALTYPSKDADKERPVYAWDIAVESGNRNLESVDQFMEWAEGAHNRVIEIFEGSITDEARALFGLRG